MVEHSCNMSSGCSPGGSVSQKTSMSVTSWKAITTPRTLILGIGSQGSGNLRGSYTLSPTLSKTCDGFDKSTVSLTIQHRTLVQHFTTIEEDVKHHKKPSYWLVKDVKANAYVITMIATTGMTLWIPACLASQSLHKS